MWESCFWADACTGRKIEGTRKHRNIICILNSLLTYLSCQCSCEFRTKEVELLWYQTNKNIVNKQTTYNSKMLTFAILDVSEHSLPFQSILFWDWIVSLNWSRFNFKNWTKSSIVEAIICFAKVKIHPGQFICDKNRSYTCNFSR